MKKFLYQMYRKVKSLNKTLVIQGSIFLFLCFYLPILLFGGSAPEVPKEEIVIKEEPTKHRVDWDRYLNPKRVAQEGKEEFKKFTGQVVIPFVAELEKDYVEMVEGGSTRKRAVESDF